MVDKASQAIKLWELFCLKQLLRNEILIIVKANNDPIYCTVYSKFTTLLHLWAVETLGDNHIFMMGYGLPLAWICSGLPHVTRFLSNFEPAMGKTPLETAGEMFVRSKSDISVDIQLSSGATSLLKSV